ncbi:hypothetical protein Agau_L101059 [Agrobacterium tumefaciens F2]|nr:hypothetical protein Agau_L101059 [Agrobacterium tumefaciens F2]
MAASAKAAKHCGVIAPADFASSLLREHRLTNRKEEECG